MQPSAECRVRLDLEVWCFSMSLSADQYCNYNNRHTFGSHPSFSPSGSVTSSCRGRLAVGMTPPKSYHTNTHESGRSRERQVWILNFGLVGR